MRPQIHPSCALSQLSWIEVRTSLSKQNRSCFPKHGAWKLALVVGLVLLCFTLGVWEDYTLKEDYNMSAGDLGYVVPGAAGAPQAPFVKGISPVTAFGSEMFSHLALKERGNVVISPLSLFVALSMATAGSTHGGQAHKELRKALKHDVVGEEDEVHAWLKAMMLASRQSDPGVKLEVANSLWAEKDVKQDFIDVCKGVFDAESLPLGGKDPVNKWVDSKTNGKIQNILAEDPLGPAVLVNAVFFKGEWGDKFDEKDSKPGEFIGIDGKAMPTTLMLKNQKKMLYAETPSSEIAQLPYGKSGRFGAVVVLPKEKGEAGMAKTISELFDGKGFEAAVGSVGKRHVILKMPRFKVEYGVKSLKDSIKALGAEAAFGSGGHFLRMTEDSSVFIDDVFHKAVIEVNEEGTVAAAATAVTMTRSLPPPAHMMTVDRPFIFSVYDLESKSILFVCKVETV